MTEQNYNKEFLIEDKKTYLREVLAKYFFHWKWFVLGLVFSLIGAFFYLRYTIPQFQVKSTILIQDKENKSFSSELSAFEDLGLASNSKSYFNTEIGILKSRSLMEKVVKKLELHKKYLQKGNIRNTELYGENLPFKINFFGKDSIVYKKDTLFSIIPISTSKFDLYNGKDEKIGTYSFGENVTSKIADFTVIPTTLTPIDIDEKVEIFITRLKTVANYYRFKVNINNDNKSSTLIEISLKDRNKEKAHDILSVLLEQYNLEAIIDKSLIAKNTDTFISERIDAISIKLNTADKDVETFKTNNNLMDLDSESNLILSSNSNLEKETLDLKTQLKLADYVLEYVNSSENKLIPTNLGLKGNSLNQISLRYNKIILERDRLMQSSNSLNPVIVNLESQITNLRASILQSLDNLKSSFTISLNDLKNQGSRISSKMTSVPKKEREYRDVQRSQQIIETLYLYLLQKREENAISLAVKVPNAKIIDPVFGSKLPVFPRRSITYFTAALAGLVITFFIFYFLFLFDNKIHALEDLESSLSIPILGDVPLLKLKGSNDDLIISNNDVTPFMEAYRIIRTNIYFILSKSKAPCKTIFVSSTISGEGKSFTAINLAKIFMLSSKKVLLVGGDIRNPKLAEYLNIPDKIGLTHYLANSSLEFETLIEHIPSLGFDIIQGGKIAPNPSELLMNGRFDELLSSAQKKYDYIIVDTAPISLVTDTMILSQDRADLFVYVIKANFLDKRLLKIPDKLNETGRIKNMAVILNGTNLNGLHGYGYGYGYGIDSKKNWFQKLFK